MEVPINSDLNVKKAHILMLIIMKDADKHSHYNEEKFIYDIANKMGLFVSDVKDAIDHPEKYKAALPKTYAERMTYFYHILYLMKIDGKVDKSEKEICRKIGFRLCLNPPLMDELIDIIADYANRNIPDDLMLKTTLKYLN